MISQVRPVLRLDSRVLHLLRHPRNIHHSCFRYIAACLLLPSERVNPTDQSVSHSAILEMASATAAAAVAATQLGGGGGGGAERASGGGFGFGGGIGVHFQRPAWPGTTMPERVDHQGGAERA